jgi:hypothetical protein
LEPPGTPAANAAVDNINSIKAVIMITILSIVFLKFITKFLIIYEITIFCDLLISSFIGTSNSASTIQSIFELRPLNSFKAPAALPIFPSNVGLF